MNNWNLEGMKVEGNYMGMPVLFVRGKVEQSRVKYGGGISHHVVLEEPIEVYGAIRERVILDHEDVTRVQGAQ